MTRPRITRRGGTVIASFLLLALAASPSRAVLPDEMLKDPVLEARARNLSQELRCVVCQNQSIDDSNAPLAHDLRVLLRDRLSTGDSDQQAMDFIVARYGNFVLLKPPMQWNTFLLWLGPLLALLLAVFGFGRYLRRAGDSGTAAEIAAPLKDDELRMVDAILGKRSTK
jgi:cytochrome c-type biogenesis protein CcmH